MVVLRVPHCSIRGGRAGQWAVWRHSLHTHDMTWRHGWLNKECDPSIFSRPAGRAKTRIDSNSLFYSRTTVRAPVSVSGLRLAVRILDLIRVFLSVQQFLAKFHKTITELFGWSLWFESCPSQLSLYRTTLLERR